MKIQDDNGLPRGIPPRPPAVQGSRTDSNASPQQVNVPAGDRVELSDQARRLQVAQGALAQLPEVRTEKVQAIKQMVMAGTYYVPGEKVAERMLGEGLFA